MKTRNATRGEPRFGWQSQGKSEGESMFCVYTISAWTEVFNTLYVGQHNFTSVNNSQQFKHNIQVVKTLGDDKRVVIRTSDQLLARTSPRSGGWGATGAKSWLRLWNISWLRGCPPPVQCSGLHTLPPHIPIPRLATHHYTEGGGGRYLDNRKMGRQREKKIEF